MSLIAQNQVAIAFCDQQCNRCKDNVGSSSRRSVNTLIRYTYVYHPYTIESAVDPYAVSKSEWGESSVDPQRECLPYSIVYRKRSHTHVLAYSISGSVRSYRARATTLTLSNLSRGESLSRIASAYLDLCLNMMSPLPRIAPQ